MANNNSLQLLMDVWAKWLSLVSVPLVRKKKYRKKKILYTVANVLELGMAEVARSLRWK